MAHGHSDEFKREATRALELLAMTAARSGEIRGALWAEFDFDAKIWTVPEGRMKAGNEHRIPLTSAAINLLESLDQFDGVPYVFPGVRVGQLSDASLIHCSIRDRGSD